MLFEKHTFTIYGYIKYDIFFQNRASPEVDRSHENPHVIRVYTDSRSSMQVVITSSQSWVDVTSNIGGMLGLCAGISLVSLAEIVYWALLFGVAKISGNISGTPVRKSKLNQGKLKKIQTLWQSNFGSMFNK